MCWLPLFAPWLLQTFPTGPYSVLTWHGSVSPAGCLEAALLCIFSQNAHLRPLQLVGLQRSHVQVAGLATLPLHLLRYWPACPLRDRRRQLRQPPSTRPRLVGGFWAYRWWGCSCQLGLGPVCARAFFSYFLIVQLLGGLGWLHMHAFPCTQGSLRTQERLLRCQATFWAGLRHPQHHGHMLRSQQQRSHTLRPR